MKTLLCAALLLALSSHAGPPPAPRVPVLVELFTSEGCSSCPRADDLLASLQRDQPVDGVEVVPLGLHVDYFNNLGWKDAFSSAAFTARQEGYSEIFGDDSVYTPQMVVDGHEAVAGNQPDLVRRAIASAAGRPHLPLSVTTRKAANTLRITIDLPAAPAVQEQIQVMTAITEDGLTTVVKRGENGGRTLHHVAVARKVQAMGPLTGEAAVVEGQVQVGRTWRPDGLKAVVWLQGLKSRQVYGAAVSPIAQ
jgi:hypothetical protein